MGDPAGMPRFELAVHESEDLDQCAATVERAVAKAREAGTPEAWRAAADATAMALDVVQATQAAVDATQAAEAATREAQALALRAQVATQAAIDAMARARQLQRSVATARATGTPEAWREAAQRSSEEAGDRSDEPPDGPVD
jgi:hypothetical protein